MPTKEFLLDIAEVARREVLTKFRLDSCIATTRVVIELCKEMGYSARPLPVKSKVFNKAFVKRLEKEGWPLTREESLKWFEEDGSWSIGVGFGTNKPGTWPGHLVAIVDDQYLVDPYLVDASIDQATRPDKDIILEPIIANTTAGFLGGEQNLIIISGKCVVTYESDMYNLDYQRSPNWKLEGHVEVVFKRALTKLKKRIYDI